MASIQVRKETGRLILDFYFQGHRCREQTALPDTPANRRKLAKALQAIETDIAAGTFEYRRYFPTSRNAPKFDAPVAVAPVVGPVAATTRADTPLFRDFANQWFDERAVEWRRSYQATVRTDLDVNLIPRFGDQVVGSITKADILAFRATLAKVTARGKSNSLSNTRINKILMPLRQILNEAADRFDLRTPFDGIKSLKIKRVDVHPFTLEEVRRILTSVRADYRDYFTVRFFTGMRTGEVHGLKWSFVDFERRLILVRQTWVMGEETYTKTDGSQRDIQMSQLVFEALQRQQAANAGRSPYVFCNRNGEPLDAKNVTNRVWYPLLRYLDLAKRRPYQCRHTAATLWLASGEAPEWIARQLGHTTTEMLFRVYSRYVPNLTRRDGSAFERMLVQNIGEQPLPLCAPLQAGEGSSEDAGTERADLRDRSTGGAA